MSNTISSIKLRHWPVPLVCKRTVMGFELCGVTDGVNDDVDDDDAVTDDVGVAVCVAVIDPEGVTVKELDGVPPGVSDAELDAELDGVSDAVGDTLGVTEGDAVCVEEIERERVDVGVVVCDGVAVSDAVGDAVGVNMTTGYVWMSAEPNELTATTPPNAL